MSAIAARQLTAALETLEQCIRTCPEEEWNASHKDAPFSQVLFHTLFYLDFYLSEGEAAFRSQEFHLRHRELFKNYEELEDVEPRNLYTPEEIRTYAEFCKSRVHECVLRLEDSLWLIQSPHRGMTRLELTIYVTRHVQHHAAQLGLRLQQLSGRTLKWVSAGSVDNPPSP